MPYLSSAVRPRRLVGSLRLVLLTTLLSAVPVLSGCRGEATSNPGAGDGDGDDQILDTPFALDDADTLFETDSVPVFELSMPDAAWDRLQEQAILERYTQANLTFNGRDIGEIAVRFKGAFGSLVLCFDEEGNLTCPKLSMKLKFSEYEENKRFFGLKRLNLHSMARDESKLREKISYKLFRDMDIPAPRSSWARLVVNGESLGLFSLVEQVDGRFTDDRFEGGGDGNLYKETWPATDVEGYFEDGIDTNEETATHETFIGFYDALASAGDSELLSTLEQWTDVDALYTYMAVHDGIGNWDGVTAWYCGDYGCFPHNFYFYQDETEDFFTLIPWDLDATLRAVTPFDHVPHWTDPGDCNTRYPVFGLIEVQAAGCTPVFQALASDRSRYEAAIDSFLTGPFQLDALESQIDQYVDFIDEEIEADPTMYGLMPWLADVDRLRGELPLLLEKLTALRNGESISAFTLDPKAVADFEDLNALQFNLGAAIYSNDASSANVGLNGNGALGGGQDLLMEFTFRDQGTTGWEQWAVVQLRMESSPTDVSALTGIRFTVVTDSAREVRIDLESDNQSAADTGAKLGWYVSSDATPRQITVLFADAAIPEWAPSPGDDRDLVLQTIRGLTLNPQVNGRDGNGLLGDGVEDVGILQVDDIEFF